MKRILLLSPILTLSALLAVVVIADVLRAFLRWAEAGFEEVV